MSETICLSDDSDIELFEAAKQPVEERRLSRRKRTKLVGLSIYLGNNLGSTRGFFFRLRNNNRQTTKNHRLNGNQLSSGRKRKSRVRRFR